MSLCWWQERGECVCGYLLLPILNSATVPDNMIWQCSSEEQPIKYGKAILFFFNDFKLLYITRVSQEWRVLLQWLKKSEFLTPPPRTPNLPVSLKMAAGTRVSRASFHRAGMPFFWQMHKQQSYESSHSLFGVSAAKFFTGRSHIALWPAALSVFCHESQLVGQERDFV